MIIYHIRNKLINDLYNTLTAVWFQFYVLDLKYCNIIILFDSFSSQYLSNSKIFYTLNIK